MKKIFSNFKRIFTYNKEYFVKCTIMSLIAAFILGLALSLSVPVSAAGEPSVGDQVVIPAGQYHFNDELIAPTSLNGFVTFPFSFNYFYDGVEYTVPEDGFYFIVFDYVDLQLDYRGSFDTTAYMDNSWLDQSLKTIFVSSDVSVSSSFASWFLSNTVSADELVISAGYYLANESMNGRYFDASNDSIDLRYYDSFSSSYVEAEGMIFTIENRDMYMIYYGPDEVFRDGWHMDAYRSIEVLNDISVDPQFYDCFFGLYSPSDADSNSYNVGFSDGYIEGRDDGYAEGYNQGYHQGLADSIGSSDTFLGGVVENVLDALDKLVIVGDVSILDILKTLIGAFVVIFFLKLIAGG